MAKLSTYMEDRIVNFMRAVQITGEAEVWVALFTADAGLEAGTLTNEVSGGAYARVLAGLGASSDGTSANGATITFATATADWGTVTHVALMDASGTEGNVVMHATLDSAKWVDDGDIFQIATGDLDVTIE